MKYRIGIVDKETGRELDSKKYLNGIRDEYNDKCIQNIANWVFCDCEDGFYQADQNIVYSIPNDIELPENSLITVIQFDEECDCYAECH
ncbi:hypothetical protein GW796_05385 [archaeon]|nr:hypothetical protein [archaeon]NCT58858.1 hypothetical protein [archaeon]